ncbi:MAG: hypothetical protein NWE93_00280 [Candidatus Bathyarchaeota archaeon]|nr:hypothetical protein [Candidatus Bathyarchaeota archaeon]
MGIVSEIKSLPIAKLISADFIYLQTCLHCFAANLLFLGFYPKLDKPTAKYAWQTGLGNDYKFKLYVDCFAGLASKTWR